MFELVFIICLSLWFLWAFIFGGFARALNGSITEWALLTITFVLIVAIAIITPLLYCNI